MVDEGPEELLHGCDAEQCFNTTMVDEGLFGDLF